MISPQKVAGGWSLLAGSNLTMDSKNGALLYDFYSVLTIIFVKQKHCFESSIGILSSITSLAAIIQCGAVI